MFTRGKLVSFSKPQGAEDKRIAVMKGERVGVVYETVNTGYVRVHFFGDREGLTYLLHPESIKLQ